MDSKENGIPFNFLSPKVISLGDCMVLMNPDKNGPLRFVHSFTKEWAGSEINFLVGCNRLGISTGFISSFSKDPFGLMIYHNLKGEGVDLSQIQWDTKRPTPIFFKERKSNQDFSVFYYRTNTAGTFLEESLVNLDYFQNTEIFFFTGIFPALSETNYLFLKDLLLKLKAKKIKLVFDPNIRLKIFKNKKDIKGLIANFLPLIDILTLSHHEAKILFSTEKEEEFFEVIKKYPNITQAVLRKGKAGSCFSMGNRIFYQKAIATEVVDTCGAGDAFNSGFVYGFLQGYDMIKSVEMGAYTASFALNSTSDNQNAPSLRELTLRIQQQNETIR